MNIPTNTVPLVILAILLLAFAAFFLGYQAGEGLARRTQRGLRAQLRLAETQRFQLAKWVRSNWPNEYAAYRHGVEEGYQQGLSHAPVLMDEAESAEGA